MEKPKVFAISNEDFDLTIRVFNDTTKQLAQLAVDYSKEKLTQGDIQPTVIEDPGPLVQGKFVRGNAGKFQGLFGKEQMLKNYGKMKIYKPILIYILLKTGYSFNMKNAEEIIEAYYKDKLKRKLTEKTRNTYAKGYIRYMVDEKIITKDKLAVCRKVNWGKKKEAELKEIEETTGSIIDEQRIQKVADDIYELATKKEWNIMRRNINVADIKTGVPNYSDEDIKMGFSRLVRFGKMRQQTPGQVVFY